MIARSWILHCDIAGCGAVYASYGKSKRSVLDLAIEAGWGHLQIGSRGILHFCPACRTQIHQSADPDMFYREIVDRDHTDDHTILLSCDHEFTKVDPRPDGLVLCNACHREWFTGGEMVALPSIKDLVVDES